MGAANFPIGVLSSETGVNIETIRYYERIGLIPAPPRTEGRQRIYDTHHLRRLTFIRRGRELGFSLDQIRSFLGLAGTHKLTCAEVEAIAQAHLETVRAKLIDLARLEHILADTVSRCSGTTSPSCPVLDMLSG